MMNSAKTDTRGPNEEISTPYFAEQHDKDEVLWRKGANLVPVLELGKQNVGQKGNTSKR